MTPAELEACFPKLRSGNYKATSDATARYNCVAFANGDERHWWQPGMNGGRYYWPTGIRQQDTLESWVELFKSKRFEATANREIEPGFDKVAIFVSMEDMLPSHVAISDGKAWKSKLGKGQDIEHSSLDLLEGDKKDEYGIVEAVLKRKLEAQ